MSFTAHATQTATPITMIPVGYCPQVRDRGASVCTLTKGGSTYGSTSQGS